MQRQDVQRQMVNNIRKEDAPWAGKDPDHIKDWIVPFLLHNTFKNCRFYWDDSGEGDENRIIIFATAANFEVLKENKDWFGDGTFSITSTIIKQLYSIHVIKNGKDFPLVYAFLPGKSYEIYMKFFTMLKASMSEPPRSFNCDFEKAVFEAVKTSWPDCIVYGCWFHLSQSFLRHIQTDKKHQLLAHFKVDIEFRKSYRMLQGLAYLPPVDVVDGFNLLKKNCINNFEPMLDYVERIYIGKLRTNSQSIREEARYPIASWNLYQRVLDDLPKTNNTAETWHGRINTVHGANFSCFARRTI